MSKLVFKIVVDGKEEVKPLEEILEVKIKGAIEATKVEKLRKEAFLQMSVLKKVRNQVTRAGIKDPSTFEKIVKKLVELDELCAQEMEEAKAIVLSNEYRQEARIVKALLQELGYKVQ